MLTNTRGDYLMSKKWIIAIIIIIILAVVGVFAFTQGGAKADTQITFLSETTLKNGDQVQFVLTDAQENPIANQEVTITYESNGETQNFTVVTDAEGKGGLLLSDQPTGEHTVIVNYNGNDQYNGAIGNFAFTIEEGTSDANTDSTSSASTAGTSASSSSSSSSDSNLNYNSEYNVHYDDNGIIHGGQNDGESMDDVEKDAEKHSQDFD